MLFAMGGCGKEETGDTPLLKLEDVNTLGVPRNSLLRFTFSFNSGFPADSLYIQKIVPDCPDTEFDVFINVPEYPSSSKKGSIEVTFVNGFSDQYTDLRSPLCGEDDTATFRFVLRDTEGNISDTVVSPQIVIFK